MFEKYNFAGVFIQIQAVLTLYAQGASRKYATFKVQKLFSFCFCDVKSNFYFLVKSSKETGRQDWPAFFLF